MTGHTTSNGTVFVAEDSVMLGRLLADALVAHGVGGDVRVFTDAPSLLAAYRAFLAQKHAARLVVLDIIMPGFDGLSAGETLRDIESAAQVTQAPIVFFSSRPLDDEIRSAVERCFPARYVEKATPQASAEVALQGARMLRALVDGTGR